MALANFIQPGTYSVVTISGYDKHNKFVSFNVDVYTDSTKTQLINSIKYILDDFNRAVVVKSRTIDDPNIIDDPQDNDMYLVPDNAVGDWALRRGDIVFWSDFYGSWQLYTYTEDKHVQIEDEEGVFVKRKNKQWVTVTLPTKSTTWATYFDASLFDQEDYDLLKGIYKFLKNERPEFAAVVDA